jgi:hypothetical protein
MEYVNIEEHYDINDFPRLLTDEDIDSIMNQIPFPFCPDPNNSQLIQEDIKNNLREALKNKKLSPSQINNLINYIVTQFNNNQVIPGTAIGMHAAEGAGRAPMQMSLDSFKNAGESKSASSSVTAVEEILYAKKEREYEICTLHYKNKYLTYEEVLQTRFDIVECVIDHFLLKTRFKTTNSIYSYTIDSYKHLTKKWWHDDFYIQTILGLRIPQDDTIILRLHFDLNELYKYRVTLEDVVDVLKNTYEGLLHIIYGPIEDAIIDIEACITYNKKAKTEKKKFDIIIASCDNEDLIDDDMIISAYYNNTLLPAIKNLKLKGITGIKNLTPIIIPVISVITQETKAWMLTGEIGQDIVALLSLLQFKIIKQNEALFINLPHYHDLDIDIEKKEYDMMTPLQYIYFMINKENQKTLLTQIYNKMKKLKYQLVYLSDVHLYKLNKLGITIQRLEELFKQVHINVIKMIKETEYITMVSIMNENILPRELVLKHVKKAKQIYNESFIYHDILNQFELIIAEVEGKNLKGLLSLDFLDSHRVTSNNMHVVASVFGIEAAQKFFIEDLNQLLSSYGLHPQHILLIAYLFFSKGIPTGAMHNSVNKPYGPIDKASVSKAVDILKTAALQGLTHQITGIATGITFGLAPKIGTHYFDIGYQYDQNTVLYNKDIYKSFKMKRDAIDQQNKTIMVVDDEDVNLNINQAIDLPGKKIIPKTLIGKTIKPKEEVAPTIKSTKQGITVKSKYDI